MGIEDFSKENESSTSSKDAYRDVKNISADNSMLSPSRMRTDWKIGSRRKNYKQIIILSFDALRERKARSALTIVMVVVGGALMVALNGMSAGQSAFMNKQMNMLAPNVLFVSSGQMNFRGPQGPPTIVLSNEVVNRIKSLPFVQEVVPSYQGQLQLNAQGNVLNAQIIAMDPQKIYLVTPSLQLVEGSNIQPNNPTAMLVGDSIANPPGKTTPFVSTG